MSLTMPPRISLSTLFESLQLAQSPSIANTSRRYASTVAQKHRKHNDPYALAQARARKAANLSRQAVLREERAQALGDPVHGIETPFLQSFDTGLPVSESSASPLQPPASDAADATTPASSAPEHLNHFVSAAGLRDSLAHSAGLDSPVAPGIMFRAEEPDARNARLALHEQQTQNAREALARITAVENANSKDRMRVNVRRCIETFGRHNTDKTLRPKPSLPAPADASTQGSAEGAQRIIERAGPDTGSSEVQIAILTAKIRTLAQFLETRGRKDKANKRNLRLLVHRRQKLLRYLRRSVRGGERWQHLIQTLGLTEGTWRGEISM